MKRIWIDIDDSIDVIDALHFLKSADENEEFIIGMGWKNE
jgi:hypothetical protein